MGALRARSTGRVKIGITLPSFGLFLCLLVTLTVVGAVGNKIFLTHQEFPKQNTMKKDDSNSQPLNSSQTPFKRKSTNMRNITENGSSNYFYYYDSIDYSSTNSNLNSLLQQRHLKRTRREIDVQNITEVLPSPKDSYKYSATGEPAVSDSDSANYWKLLHPVPPLPCSVAGECPLSLVGGGADSLSNNVGAQCQCDADCQRYGDCCRYHNQGSEVPQPNLGHWSCKPLPGADTGQGVFMVDSCPPLANSEYAKLCNLSVPAAEHTPMMDVPVVSRDRKTVYQNAYCAHCHEDYSFLTQFGSVACAHRLKDRELFNVMRYIPMERVWVSKLNGSQIVDFDENVSVAEWIDVKCFARLRYDNNVGRKCINNEVKACSNSTPCSNYRSHVRDSSGNIYKNYECALCNGVNSQNISCSSQEMRKVKVAVDNDTHFIFCNISVSSGDCTNKEPMSLEKYFCACGGCQTDTVNDSVCDNKSVVQNFSKNVECVLVTHETRNTTVLFNNSLYVNETQRMYKYGEYEITSNGLVRVCDLTDPWTHTMLMMSRTLLTISLVALALHMFIFISLPMRRNTPSKNLFSLSLSLFAVELIFVTLFYSTENKVFCKIISVIMYYFLCSSFLWMNVLSIDICRTFHSTSFKAKPHKLFIQYSLYAWLVPVLCASVAFLIDQFARNDSIFNPGFGTYRCWFNNKWGLVVFFTLPAGVIVLINMVLFIVSVVNIYKQHMEGQLASASIKTSSSSTDVSAKKPKYTPTVSNLPECRQKTSIRKLFKCDSELAFKEKLLEKMQKRMAAHRKLKIRLLLYCKLALIMGMTWIFAFISIHTKSIIFEYLFIIFNGLQGTFIFLAFDCKEKVWNDLKQRFNGTQSSQNNSRYLTGANVSRPDQFQGSQVAGRCSRRGTVLEEVIKNPHNEQEETVM